MRTGIKILLIVIGFLFVGLIIAALKIASGRSSGAGGPIGIILMFAFFAGARAIWKYNPKKEEQVGDNQIDKHQLNKE